MISVIIPTSNAARVLPRCFESLIPGVVSGVVREVIVADGGSSDETLNIADAAGAHVVNCEWPRGSCMAAGASIARCDWLLFLHPETALESGWEHEAEGFVERATLERPRAATFRFALDDFGPRARRKELLWRMRSVFLGLHYGEQGLLLHKRFYLKLGGHSPRKMEDIDLIRRIGRRRLVTFRSHAINKVVDGQGSANAVLVLLHALRFPRRLMTFISD
jgi:glycosyltransferase involved in cell wall biosynthesis